MLNSDTALHEMSSEDLKAHIEDNDILLSNFEKCEEVKAVLLSSVVKHTQYSYDTRYRINSEILEGEGIKLHIVYFKGEIIGDSPDLAQAANIAQGHFNALSTTEREKDFSGYSLNKETTGPSRKHIVVRHHGVEIGRVHNDDVAWELIDNHFAESVKS